MTTGPDGLDLIEHYESLRLDAYPDPATGAEPITIGWGHTGGVKMGDRITRDEAVAFLLTDLAEFERGVTANVHAGLTQKEFDALVSFSFNVGLGNLKKSTLLIRVNARNTAAAQEEFLKWNKGNGKVMKGLQRRRKAESLVFGGVDSDVAIAEALRLYP